jgi:hypothetical protein
MPKTTEEFLADAYILDQVKKDRASAIKLIKDEIPSAEREWERLGKIVKARTLGGRGGRCACHISKVTYDLLSAALGKQ